MHHLPSTSLCVCFVLHCHHVIGLDVGVKHCLLICVTLQWEESVSNFKNFSMFVKRRMKVVYEGFNRCAIYLMNLEVVNI